MGRKPTGYTQSGQSKAKKIVVGVNDIANSDIVIKPPENDGYKDIVVEEAPRPTKTIVLPYEGVKTEQRQFFFYNRNGVNYQLERGVELTLDAELADCVMRKAMAVGIYTLEIEPYRNKSKKLN